LYPIAYIITFERPSEITQNIRICGLHGRNLNCSSLPAKALYLPLPDISSFPVLILPSTTRPYHWFVFINKNELQNTTL